MRASLVLFVTVLSLACGGGPPAIATPSAVSAAVHLPLPDDVLDLELADRSGMDPLVFARFTTLQAPAWAASQGFTLADASADAIPAQPDLRWWRFAGGQCGQRDTGAEFTQLCLEPLPEGGHAVLVRYQAAW